MTRQKTQHLPLKQRRAQIATSLESDLRRYFGELSKTTLLTAEQEVELARKIQQGDGEAFRNLIAANLRLVVKIALQYRTRPSQIMDLIQEGNLGLARAAKHFDPERGIRFAPYAIWWIRAAILRTILEQHRLVRLGTTAAQRKIFFQLDKVRAKIAAIEGEASDERVAEVMGVKSEEISSLEGRMHRPEASFDAPQGMEGRPLSEVLADPKNGPEEEVLRKDLRELLDEVIAVEDLAPTAREQAILTERLLSDEPLTLDELGARFGVSRERIRQLEKTLLTQLRRRLSQKLRVREIPYLFNHDSDLDNRLEAA